MAKAKDEVTVPKFVDLLSAIVLTEGIVNVFKTESRSGLWKTKTEYGIEIEYDYGSEHFTYGEDVIDRDTAYRLLATILKAAVRA